MKDKFIVLESPSGLGQIIAREGGATVKVRYQLAVYQRMIRARSGEFIPAARRIDGRISQPDDPLFAIRNVGKYYTLRLADSRRLDFFFSDQNGSIANTSVRLYSEAA